MIVLIPWVVDISRLIEEKLGPMGKADGAGELECMRAQALINKDSKSLTNKEPKAMHLKPELGICRIFQQTDDPQVHMDIEFRIQIIRL